MESKPPWEVDPRLTLDRLHVVRTLIAEGRRSAEAARTFEDAGTDWGIHCLAYQRELFWIALGAESEFGDWLGIVRPTLDFVFSLEGVPFRMYRGDPQRPKRNVCIRSGLEARVAQASLFPEYWAEGEWAWRIAIETDESGELSDAVAVQVLSADNFSDFLTNDKAEVRHPFSIPPPEADIEETIIATARRALVAEGAFPRPVIVPPPTTTPAGAEEEEQRPQDD